MGIVAHPGEVTCVAVSHDGKYIFSAGGYDLSVNMWKINVEEHQRDKLATRQNEAGEADQDAADGEEKGAEQVSVPARPTAAQDAAALRPYFSLLEGGEGGELHRDIVDYFYYCQLRHLGEDSMETRNLTGKFNIALSRKKQHGCVFYKLADAFIYDDVIAGEIPLDEIPSLFRSVGYYPSEDEVLNIINEVRYKNFVNTGETQEYVGLVRTR